MSFYFLFREEAEGGNERNVQVPIGVPVHNCIAYVLNSELEPVEEGGVGALYISSRNLGRGYTGALQGSFLSNTREEADTSKALSGVNILLERQLVTQLLLCSARTWRRCLCLDGCRTTARSTAPGTTPRSQTAGCITRVGWTAR